MPSHTVVVQDGAWWCVFPILSGHTLHIEIIGDPTCLADKVVVLVQQGMDLFNYTFQWLLIAQFSSWVGFWNTYPNYSVKLDTLLCVVIKLGHGLMASQPAWWHTNKLHNCRFLSLVCLVLRSPLSIDISTINPSYWGYVHQLGYIPSNPIKPC